MAFWLLKSEPETFPVNEFRRVRVSQWDGVRNYQARNYLQTMQEGEPFLFYHSNSEPTGVAGIGRIKRAAYPDSLQFIKKSDYFEPRATKEKPVWYAPDVEFVQEFDRIVTLAEIREESELKGMVLLQKGSRLSVQPVTEKEFKKIVSMSKRR